MINNIQEQLRIVDLKIGVMILLSGVFGLTAFGGILIAIGESFAKPETIEAGWAILKIGGFAILATPFLMAFLRKRKII